jgi:rhamnose utilization protein RhaD (predicted bifunctional aldolase and dehydrogenase)
MKESKHILAQLVALSCHLGDPARDYAILGEGNTSARLDADTFWVKASGAALQSIDAGGFVRMDFQRTLALLEAGQLNDAQVKAGLQAARADLASARVEPGDSRRPSVETILHALALQLQGVDFVGHTHPTAVNAILCSRFAAQAVSGRLFPDEIVYCGPAPLFLPYTDPGLPLARAVRQALNAYSEEHGQPPKVILMQNHGFIALGQTPTEVEHITAMYVKTARVLLGAYALGGPNFLSPAAVERIHTRPDERYRQELWGRR